MLRTRVFSFWPLRILARALVHLRPALLGAVSEGFEGIFSIRPAGLPLEYDLGPKDAVGDILLWCGPGQFEHGTLSTFARLASKSRGVLDIGANTGLYSMIACAANAKVQVIAWEPVPYLFERLQRNVSLNQFTARCDLRPHALAEVTCRRMIYIPRSTTMASLTQTFSGEATTPLEVNVETVDSVLAPDFPLDLVKLDVEGHEYDVLRGMAGTLARHSPTIIFECLPSTPAEPINEMLLGLGYTLREMTSAGLVAIPAIGPVRCEGSNYLAVHPGRGLPVN
jgi:FkbM family methyltransferase